MAAIDMDLQIGEMIARRRKALGMTQKELGVAIGFPNHYQVNHWEKGRRSVRSPGGRNDEAIRLLADVLQLDGHDLALLAEASGIADLQGAPHPRPPLDEAAEFTERDYARLDWWLGRFGVRRRYWLEGVSWAKGRLRQLKMHTYDALGLQEPARSRAYVLLGRGDRSEMTSLVLQDAAVSHITAGMLVAGEGYAWDDFLVTRDRWRDGTNDKQRAAMGVARAIIARQMIAYLKGDELGCVRLYDEAVPRLSDAQDEYGWAKSLYLCGKLHFYRGDIQEAYRLAKDAHTHAQGIGLFPTDLFWVLRDGLIFGLMWWKAIAENFLFDMVVCMGPDAPSELAEDRLDRWADKLDPLWARDFPPFRSHYRWVVELDQKRPVRGIEERFERWIRDSMICGNIFELPCTLISFGDFLLATGNPERADQQYGEAERVATEHGFDLHKNAARRRRTREWLPPVIAAGLSETRHS